MGQPWVLSEKTDVAEVQAQLILRSWLFFAHSLLFKLRESPRLLF
jgi:hypothetical protein